MLPTEVSPLDNVKLVAKITLTDDDRASREDLLHKRIHQL